MHEITTPKPYRIHFKDGRDPLAMNEEQFQHFKNWKDNKKLGDWYEVEDEQGNIHGFLRTAIKDYEKKQHHTPTSIRTYTCDWGNTHPSHIDRCDCWGTYKMSGLKMWRYIKEKWDIHYNHQITEEMRRYALERHRDNNQI